MVTSGHDLCLHHVKCKVDGSYDPEACESCKRLIESIKNHKDDMHSSVLKWSKHVNSINLSLPVPLKWVNQEIKKFYILKSSMIRSLKKIKTSKPRKRKKIDLSKVM